MVAEIGTKRVDLFVNKYHNLVLRAARFIHILQTFSYSWHHRLLMSPSAQTSNLILNGEITMRSENHHESVLPQSLTKTPTSPHPPKLCILVIVDYFYKNKFGRVSKLDIIRRTCTKY
jgi:hypothetical protein